MSAAIQIAGLTKRYGSFVALGDVSLEIPRGQIFGFLGPNGAGKTTTIRCLMDFIRPDAGRIRILGEPVRGNAALKRRIGYLSSDLQLNPGWTGRTHVEYLAGIRGFGRAREVAQRLELDTGKKAGDLSSGNQQKLAIVLAFLGRPDLLIMDEPTRALDPLLQNQLYGLLREFAAGGGTVFFSSHNLAEVQSLCDSVAVIRRGQIIAAESMGDILKVSLHNITATATQAFNEQDFHSPDIKILSHEGHSISLKVTGSIDAPVKVLAQYHLTDLEITHANLEDVFMEFYS
jgi:ABC-2 type transport system ATP-binding protein